MAQLNRNNFLNWFGTVHDAPFSIVAANGNVNVDSVASTAVLNPFNQATSTYPINFNTVEITLHDNPTNPPYFDASINRIIYNVPAGVAVGEVRVLKFKIYDIVGHVSAEKQITISIVAPAVGWRGYASSYQCRLDFSGRTNGNGYFIMLEKYYISNGKSVLPLTLKENVQSDPNYIPDTVDAVKCPVDPFFKQIRVYNQSAFNTIIDRIVFTNSSNFNSTTMILLHAGESDNYIMPSDSVSFTVYLTNPHTETLTWVNVNNQGSVSVPTNSGQISYSFSTNVTPPPGLIAGDLYIL